MMEGILVKNKKTITSRTKKALTVYSFSFLILVLFISVLLIFEGVALQLIIFLLGLTLLGSALFQNMVSETQDEIVIPNDEIKVKIESYFPNIHINEVRKIDEKEGKPSIFLQIEGKDIESEHIKSKVIRKFVQTHFNAEEVIIELL